MFTEKEKAALKVMARLQDKGSTFTIDQFADKFYGHNERPESWRQNLATLLRTLSLKLQITPGSYSLTRVSGLGTGAVGEYKVTGLIERIVKRLQKEDDADRSFKQQRVGR